MPTAPSPVPLSCACGALHGLYVPRPGRGARGVCYCDDCQAWAAHLGTPGLVDAWGGTEVVQSWPAQVRLIAGKEHLALGRLTAKGLHRWYAACCRTPIANSFGVAWLPFTGVMRRALRVDDATLDAWYGPAHGVQGRFARGGVPPGAHASATVGIVLRAMGILARGFLAGAARPSPYFADGTLVAVPHVLGADELALARR